MLSKYLKLIETATEESGFEPRMLLISTSLMIASAYSFDPYVSLAIIAISYLFSPKKALSATLASLPFIALIALFSYRALTALAIVCMGSLIYGTPPEEFGYALMYFRVPPRIANSVSVSMRMFRLAVTDLERVCEVVGFEGLRGFKRYSRILRAISVISVLRALSLSEVLYSRGFNFDRRIVVKRRPKGRDIALLIASLAIFIYTYPIRSAL